MNTARVVAFSGAPGTGKSTLADEIARDLDAPAVSWDWLVAGLTIFPEVQQVFEAMERDTFRDVGYAQYDAPMFVVECVCSDVDLHRSRVVGRTRGIPGWNELEWEWVESSRRSYEPLQCDKVVLDAVDPLTDNLARVRAYLRGKHERAS